MHLDDSDVDWSESVNLQVVHRPRRRSRPLCSPMQNFCVMMKIEIHFVDAHKVDAQQRGESRVKEKFEIV